MKNTIIYIGITAVLVGGLSFYGGMKYQSGKTSSQFTRFSGSGNNRMGGNLPGGNNRQGGNRNGMRPVAGQILSKDDKSITVKLNDGSSKIVLFSASTQINKADKATVDDLKVGDTVAAFGTDNSDGSVTANNIQLNPEFQRFGNNQGGSNQPVQPTGK